MLLTDFWKPWSCQDTRHTPAVGFDTVEVAQVIILLQRYAPPARRPAYGMRPASPQCMTEHVHQTLQHGHNTVVPVQSAGVFAKTICCFLPCAHHACDIIAQHTSL
jgi:hypothetical protein